MEYKDNLITFHEKETKGFYSHLNLTSLEDPTLGTSAKCVHIYFLTRPNGWKMFLPDIYKKLGISERTYQRAVLELEDKGYLYRTHNQFFNNWKYIRCETPIPKEEAEKLTDQEYSLYTPRQIDAPPRPRQIDAPLVNNNNKGTNINITNLSFIKNDNAVPKEQQYTRKLKKRPTKENISLGLKRNIIISLNKETKPIPPKIKELLDFHSATLHKYRTNSNAYFESAKTIGSLMAGKFFNHIPQYSKYKNYKFTFEEIKGVLERLIRISSPDYLPVNKKPFKEAFNRIAYNPLSDSKDFRSNFIYYFENEPKFCGNGVSLIDDPDKDLTDSFKHYYKQRALAGREHGYTNIDENNFRKTTKQALEFFNFHKSNINAQSKSSFLEAVLKAFDLIPVEKLYPKTMASDHTWTRVVTNHFTEQNAMNRMEV